MPLRIAWIDWIWLAVSDWLMAAMIGMPPATAASKAMERPSCRARSNSSGAVLGQQGLVGRDHVLAAFQQLQHDRAIRLHPADQLHHGGDLRVVEHLGQVVGQHARAGASTLRGRVRSGSTTCTNSSRCPACWAMRSPCSSSSRATPEPMVPNPMMATLVVFMVQAVF